nr:MAG TPA: hypothetical protein [Caudoviricetes sp.]
MSFVNYSNHVSNRWSSAQLEAAKVYGDVIDIPFAQVSPSANKAEVDALAVEEVQKILDVAPSVVMVQGEMTLVYNVVRRLEARGIECVAACTRRRTDEEVQKLAAAGLTKEGMFEFMGFREY